MRDSCPIQNGHRYRLDDPFFEREKGSIEKEAWSHKRPFLLVFFQFLDENWRLLLTLGGFSRKSFFMFF